MRRLDGLVVALELVAVYASGSWLSLVWPLALVRLPGRGFGDKRRVILSLLGIGALLTIEQAILFEFPKLLGEHPFADTGNLAA